MKESRFGIDRDAMRCACVRVCVCVCVCVCVPIEARQLTRRLLPSCATVWSRGLARPKSSESVFILGLQRARSSQRTISVIECEEASSQEK